MATHRGTVLRYCILESSLTFCLKIMKNLEAETEKNSGIFKCIPCTVCNSDSYRWVELPKAILFRCIECAHCFTDVSSIAKAETYGSKYYQETHKNWFANPNYALFSELASELSFYRSRSVLDVGCGNGALLKYLAEGSGSLSLQGIDLSDAASSIAGIEFRQGDFLTCDFQKRFDAVITLAVIEHLYDVASFVRRIHELLNKDGIACIMTLNESGVLYEFASLLRKIGVLSVFIRLYDPHHINHFSRESLVKLLTRDGLFRVRRIIDHNTPLAAIDIPVSGSAMKLLMKLGVAVVFFLGKITNKSYLQTIVVTKVG